jgi:hypothetical protein
VFELALESINQSGFGIEWQTNGISNTTLSGSVLQAAGTTFKVTFRFVLAGTAPDFLGTTLNVNLTSVTLINTLYQEPNGDLILNPGGGANGKLILNPGGGYVEIGINPLSKLHIDGDITCDNILSGTFTPTSSNLVFISDTEFYNAQYMRVGNVVNVSGKVDLTGTAGGNKYFNMSVPINSAMGTNRAGGSINDGSRHNTLLGSSTANEVQCYIEETGAFSARGFHYNYTYLIS